MNNRLINTKVAGGGGCTDIVDNYDPFGGNGVALYQFNGDLTDVSTNWNLSASGVNYPSGAFGQAVAGNIIPNPSWGMETSSQITISWWGRSTDGIAEIWGYLGQAGDNPLIRLSNGSIRFEGNGSQIDHSFTAPAVGTNWNHYAITIDCSTGFINHYRNSEQLLVNADAGTSTLIGNLSGYGFFSGSSNTYSGQNVELDQVRIFNTALTPLEVEALYTEELCICDGTVDTLDVLGDGSCIATYQLDGNANDLSGNYSGTPTDVSYGVGEFDLAGVFNGSSSVFNLPAYFSNPNTNSSTLSIWFKSNINDGNLRSIFANRNVSGGAAYDIYAINGILRFAHEGNLGGNGVVNGTTTVTDGNWHHIAVVLDNPTGVLNIYLDGNTSSAEITLNFTANSSLNLFGLTSYIGSTFFVERYWNGEIDQVRIFNKALNSTEVTTLYNETACTKAACTGTTNTLDILGDGSCIAAYPLDGSPADLSGNYNGVQTDVTYPVGEFDLAAAFNGSSSKINLPDGAGSTGAVTVSTWINTNNITTTQGIWSFGTPLNTSTYCIEALIESSYVFFRIFNSNGTIGVIVQTGVGFISNNTWHNVVCVFSNTSTTNACKLYIDGVERATGTFTLGSITRNTTNSGFGGRFYSGSLTLPFNGEIDQVRIFNKALSAGEVTTLYNETPCN